LKTYSPTMASDLVARVERLSSWVWAQLAIALYFSLVFSIGLKLLGVPFAFTIGLVGGVLEILPYLGGAIALVLATLSALTLYPLLVLWVVIYYLVVEIESHFVAPALYGRITGIHPAAVLIALLVGAKLGGILGLLFAIPITIVLLTINNELQNLVNPPSGGE
jgi:predicted PurR-regulated permease PerM